MLLISEGYVYPQESKAFSVFHEHAHKLDEYLTESRWTNTRILYVSIIISFQIYVYEITSSLTRQVL